MGRHHIHCASGLFGEQGVISGQSDARPERDKLSKGLGMRSNCDLYIYIDVERALDDGIIFERSSNGVILTKGQEGVLPATYFKSVSKKNGKKLWPKDEV